MSGLLFITTNLQGSGGVSRILSVKLDYLIKEYGYNIHVITTNNKSKTFFYSFNKNIVFHKIDIDNFGFKYLFKYKNVLQSIILKVNPKIIINCDNGLKGSLLPYLIKTEAFLVYERHGSKQIRVSTYKEYFKNKISNFILKKSANKYNAFVVLNEEEKKNWSALNIKVITNPLWFNKLHNKDIILESKVVVAIGRHSKEKQFEQLLKIWREVIKEYPDWVLKIYGESNSKTNLKKQVYKLKLMKHAELLPVVKDIKNIYLSADMLLNTSSSEAFGLVIIEAMACGLPVVAFDIASGPKDLVVNNYNGFLIEGNDFNSYLNHVKHLIQNKALRYKLGMNAKESVKKFDLHIIMKQWHELYKSF